MAKFPFTNLTNLLLSFITFSNIIYNKQEHYDRLTARTRWNTYYDYIIVGGGTAGSVLAARLTEDESLTVLLLEAGGSETVSSNTPGLQEALLGSLMDWKMASVPQNWSCQAMNDRRCLMSAGRVIGGTSSINRMYYLRGNPADYDGWVEKFGLKSWGWKDTFPYIIRNENQTDPDRSKSGYFGVNGPMPLEKSSEYHHLLESFVFSSKISGYKISDLNTGVPIGSSILQTTTRKGRRMSTASAFLEPALKRRNLHILSNSYVYQILFDGKQAIGVRFYRNWKPYTVYAKQEILLSAGAINSAKLLMLSGVGPREELSRHQIPLVADLPVGENFHDHVGANGLHFMVDLPEEVAPSASVNKQTLKQYFHTGKGPLAEARVAATLFKSTTAGSTSGGIPILESSRHYQDEYPFSGYHAPAQQESSDLMLLAYLSGLGSKEMTPEQAQQRNNLRQEVWNRYYKPHKSRNQFTILPVVMKPKSRGTVKLHSSNPLDSPQVDPNYLDHPEDLDRLVEAMREALRLVQSRPFRAFNTELFRSVIPGCETEAPYQFQEPIVPPSSTPSIPEPLLEEPAQPILMNTPQQDSLLITSPWPSSLAAFSSSVPSIVSAAVPIGSPPPPVGIPQVGAAPQQQNPSMANKIVASILTKLLQTSQHSPAPNTNVGLGLGSFFGLRNRKQRSIRRDTFIIRKRNNYTSSYSSSPSTTDYERYWLQGGGTTPNKLNYNNQNNLVDGFSSVGVGASPSTLSNQYHFTGYNHIVPEEAEEEEIVSVWSNHKTRNRNLTLGGRPGGVGGIGYSPHFHYSVAPTSKRTTTTTSTTTTTTTVRPTTIRWITKRTTTTMPTTMPPTTRRTTTTPPPTTTTTTRRPTTTTRIPTTTTATPTTRIPTTTPPMMFEVFTEVVTTPPTRTPPLTPYEIHRTSTPPPVPTVPQTAPTLIPPLSDRYLRCMARQLTAPMGDYVGTARMGADDDFGRVVDGRFRVVGGIENLRVIDASVVPEIVAGGMAPVAMMIGERGADFIKEDLRRSPGDGDDTKKKRRKNRMMKVKEEEMF